MREIISDILLWVEQLGYWGIMIGLMIEVIPSEIVLAYGGYLVSKGHISFIGAVIFGVIGGTIAQIFVYWIGRYGGRPFLEKYGKYILINKHHIDVAEDWFNRYGTGVIFTARFIPVVRHAISIPAGITRMSLGRFTLLTTLAVIPWSIFFVYLGWTLGDNWENIGEAAGPYVKPIMYVAIALLALYVGYKWWSGRRKRQTAAQAQAQTAAQAQGSTATDSELAALTKDYILFQKVTLQRNGQQLNYDLIAIGANGVFFRHNESGEKDASASQYRREFALKDLLKSANIEADIVGISNIPGAITNHRTNKPLDAAATQHIAEQIRKAII